MDFIKFLRELLTLAPRTQLFVLALLSLSIAGFALYVTLAAINRLRGQGEQR